MTEAVPGQPEVVGKPAKAIAKSVGGYCVIMSIAGAFFRCFSGLADAKRNQD